MLNKITLIGRLTSDPELRLTANETAVTNYTLAVARDYGKDKQTDFIDIVAWRGGAEFAAKHFKKGMQVAVVGRLETRNWEDKNGNKRKAVEVKAEEQYFAEGKGSSEVQIAPGVAVPIDIDDDLPWETSGDDDLLF
jgi:single-strand DNA-binding protein